MHWMIVQVVMLITLLQHVISIHLHVKVVVVVAVTAVVEYIMQVHVINMFPHTMHVNKVQSRVTIVTYTTKIVVQVAGPQCDEIKNQGFILLIFCYIHLLYH